MQADIVNQTACFYAACMHALSNESITSVSDYQDTGAILCCVYFYFTGLGTAPVRRERVILKILL